MSGNDPFFARATGWHCVRNSESERWTLDLGKVVVYVQRVRSARRAWTGWTASGTNDRQSRNTHSWRFDVYSGRDLERAKELAIAVARVIDDRTPFPGAAR